MVIRLARVSDAAGLRKLNDAFNGEGCNSTEAIKESLESNKSEIVLVAAENDILLGFCCGQRMKSMCYSGEYAEITELFVMEDHRRRGIGAKLLSATENELRKLGAKHFHILTGNDNKAAQALYIANGYSISRETLLDKN